MSRASAFRRRALSVVVVTALVVSVAPAAFGGAAPPRGSATAASTAPGSVVSASEQASTKKLASSLADVADTGGAKLVDVLVMAAKGTKAPAYLQMPLCVKLGGDTSNVFYAGKVRADRLVKLATSKGVLYVADNGKKAPPPIPDVKKRTKAEILAGTAKAKAALKAATKSGTMKRFADAVNADTASPAPVPGSGGAPTGWHDVGPTHDSAAAWANGFTGDGVRVAVADDGLDFGHPDLQGTQAYNTDPSSPYVGWPMAFDPFSTYLYALDQYFGTDYTASGYGWFSSTEATMAGTTSGTWGSDTYALPDTSKSGVYHIGRLWDENLAAYWYGTPSSPVYTSILVADETTAGVYDTVYVDLDYNGDFTDDKKCTKDDPISYADVVDKDGNDGSDGYADISGGMVYWISDGVNHPPLSEFEFGSPGWTAPGSGDLVCMMGAYDLESDHGTLCGSNVTGQGRIDGASIYGETASFKSTNTWTVGGVVQGAGRDAGLVAISDVYSNYALSTLLAYDFVSFGPDGTPESGDEIQVMSNSYGESGTDNDEWDYPSRYISGLNEFIAPSTSFLFSTGNGGPGYGTNAPPSPSTGIGVGASTQMGANGGWDSIDTLDQVTYGDVIPFSNRGPSAMGHIGPTIVADGAYASGAKVLSLSNGVGWTAWEIWGGTSRSCPVAAGNMTLIYEAFKSNNGRWPTYAEAKDLMASGATDLNYDTLVQGSGSVNADRSTRLAAGLDDAGVAVAPSVWYPGSYRGEAYPAFQTVVHPGGFDSTTLEVTNPGTKPATVDVSDSWMQRTQTVTMSVTLDPSEESAYDFNRPDWLTDITGLIPADAELMVVRAVLPYAQFDSNANYAYEHRYRLVTYDWTDRDSSGGLWTDGDTNGFVNDGELDANEYMRFTYSNAVGTSEENRVQSPKARAHDGVMLGLQHQNRGAGGPVTLEIEISFWNRADMPWLGAGVGTVDVAAGATKDVPVFLSVPSDAPLGTYEGEFRLRSDGSTVTVVPVVVTVAGTGTDITYGGATPYEQLQDTGKVFGYTDWAWRAEAGDWRFFSTDVPDDAPLGPGSLWLAHTTWSGMPTDLDTLVYGPQPPESGPESFFGPYDLGYKGGSPNTNLSAGIWSFDTATGGTEDWVTGQIVPGLNQLMIHNVLYSGASVGTTFSGETGILNADPMEADIVDTATHHAVDFAFASTMDLPGFDAEAFGLGRPWFSGSENISQGGNWYHEFDVAHAAYIDAETMNGGSDIDLYVQRFNGASWVTLGASESGGGDEGVRINAPADGHYRMRVYGFSVPGGTDTFGAYLTVPQGTDITVGGIPSGPVSAGTTITLTASFSKDRTALDDRDGAYQGVLACGPAGAGSALQLPITLRYPFEVESTNPADGASGVASTAVVTAVFTKHVATATVDAASFYLMDGTTKVTGVVTYDPLTATAHLDAPLSADTTYTAVLADTIEAADGDPFAGHEWEFKTAGGTVRRATAVTLDIPAAWVRYGKTTPAMVQSRIAGLGTAARASDVADSVAMIPDVGAPIAIMFQKAGASTWTTYTTGYADLLGRYHPAVGGTQAGYYKAVRLETGAAASSESNVDGVGIMFDPALKASASSARRGTAIRMDVVVKPTAVSKGRTVAVQRWNGTRWVTYRYVGLSAAGTVTFFENSSTATTKRVRVVIGPWAGWGGAASNEARLRWY